MHVSGVLFLGRFRQRKKEIESWVVLCTKCFTFCQVSCVSFFVAESVSLMQLVVVCVRERERERERQSYYFAVAISMSSWFFIRPVVVDVVVVCV